MLFNVTKNGGVELQDDRALAVPEFNALMKSKNLGGPYFKYICMVYDYDSPYAYLPKGERVNTVKRDIWGEEGDKMDPEESRMMKVCIEKYSKLQYDPLRDTYFTLSEKISNVNKQMRKNKDVTKEDMDIMVKQDKLIEQREKLKEMIVRREESGELGIELEGGGVLNFLEELQMKGEV